MRYRKIFFSAIALLCLVTLAYSHTGMTNEEAYRLGYERGYSHGTRDLHSGLDPDYMSQEYRSGISDDTYTNARFRSAYKEGYWDGYAGHASASSGSWSDSRQSGNSRGLGSVTAFTGDGFEGSMGSFSVGRYPVLSGRWNDSIESIQVLGPVRVILFDQRDFQGQQLILEEASADLDDWNFGSRAASMIVEPR